MSRTDRHRPHWVQQADPLEQNWYWFHQGLTWGWHQVLLHRTCGDRWCGPYYYRKAENRQDRHEAQRQARDAVKGGEWD